MERQSTTGILRRLGQGAYLATATLVVLIAGGGASAVSAETESTVCGFDDNQKRTVRMATSLIELNHYLRRKIDLELSGAAIENLANSLDSEYWYLSAEDFARMRNLESTLGADLRAGRLATICTEILAAHAAREYRWRLALEIIDEEHNFHVDEYLELNRATVGRVVDSALNELWRKRVKHELLELELSGTDRRKAAEVLRARYSAILAGLPLLSQQDVLRLILDSVASALDPHSAYLPPPDTQAVVLFRAASAFGVNVERTGDYLEILGLQPGGAAIGAGLQVGDRITAIGESNHEILIDIAGMSSLDVAHMFSANSTAAIRLRVLPKGARVGERETIVTVPGGEPGRIPRSTGRVVTTEQRGVQFSIGVLTIPVFFQDYAAKRSGSSDYASTTRDIIEILSGPDFEDVDGLLIDLRDNQGGQLNEALSVARTFIPEGGLMQLREYGPKVKIFPLQDWDFDYYESRPLGILLNRNSAGGTEIFAAAIQDYRRGVVLGQQSFGMGTTQYVFTLDRKGGMRERGGLKLTIGSYHRVTGESIQQRGVSPDISLPSGPGVDTVGEERLNRPLAPEQMPAINYSPYNWPLDDLIARLTQYYRDRNGGGADPEADHDRSSISAAVSPSTRISLHIDQRRIARAEHIELAKRLFESRRRPRLIESKFDMATVEQRDPTLAEALEIAHDLVQSTAIATSAD